MILKNDENNQLIKTVKFSSDGIEYFSMGIWPADFAAFSLSM